MKANGSFAALISTDIAAETGASDVIQIVWLETGGSSLTASEKNLELMLLQRHLRKVSLKKFYSCFINAEYL